MAGGITKTLSRIAGTQKRITYSIEELSSICSIYSIKITVEPKKLIFKETAISTDNKKWFTARIMPYRTLDDRIDGLVITFIDITEAKNMEAKLANANKIERGERASDLILADKEIVIQSEEKEKLQTELDNAIELLKKHNLYK